MSERTGGARVQWNVGSADDAAAGAAVRELPSAADGELTADDAVQVALLNNRRLQATYVAGPASEEELRSLDL